MDILQQSLTYQIFAIIFGTLLLDLVVRRVLVHLAAKTKKTKNFWDDALFASLCGPVSWLIWILGISYAIDLLQDQKALTVLQINEPVRRVAVIFLFAWFVNRLIQRISDGLIKQKKEVDVTAVTAVTKLLRISVTITAVLVTLQTLGYSISGVLAFGGIGGIAVGFAAKDLLSNFFGGLMIYLDRPFSIGDWVRSPDREIEGTVEHIGWRQTRIRTFDKRLLYVPNSVFTSISVENPSRMTHRRIHETLGLRYQDIDALPAILADVKKMLTEHDGIDENNTFIVNFNRYGQSSLDFFIYVMTHTTDWATYHEVKEDVLLKCYEIIRQHGADIAFPTTTLDPSDNLAHLLDPEKTPVESEPVRS
ncbi:MAG: mechanosensitive ion channel family protein [Gammaproteobacteria bacterium]|nr:MAG: mechanosensitive ion channel family protein [Gammaproteobacteria bacterium]